MYSIDYTHAVGRFLKKLNKTNRPALERIDQKITSLKENPRPNGVEKLSGDTTLRVREGDFRIIYDVDDGNQKITVTKVGDRKEVYKNK